MFKDNSPFKRLEQETFRSHKVFIDTQTPLVLIRPNEYLGSTPQTVSEQIKRHKILLEEFESYGILLPMYQHVLGHKYQEPQTKNMYASHVLVERINGINLDKLTREEAIGHEDKIEKFLENLIRYHKNKYMKKEPTLVDVKGLYQYRLGRSSISKKEGIFLIDIENISTDVWQTFTQLSGYNELLTTVRETEWLIQKDLPVIRTELTQGVLQVKRLVPNKIEENYKRKLLDNIAAK